MIAEQNTYRYSFEFPDGELFMKGDEIPESFVDTPTKLGIKRLDSAEKIAEICKKGLGEAPDLDEKSEDDSEDELKEKLELETLRGDYMEKFDKKPHHLMKAQSIKDALK